MKHLTWLEDLHIARYLAQALFSERRSVEEFPEISHPFILFQVVGLDQIFLLLHLQKYFISDFFDFQHSTLNLSFYLYE